MADLGEIGNAINVLTEYGTRKDDITVLHCNTEYPTPFEDVNLSAMLTIRDAFKVKVGYSDHTPALRRLLLLWRSEQQLLKNTSPLIRI